MQADDNASPPALTPTGVLFLRGYAASLCVNRGQLVARSGSGTRLTETRFARGSRERVRRVVIFGRGGYATWEALGWLKGVGASFLCLDASGEPLAFSGHSGADQPALRRAQATGLDNDSGREVTRYLLTAKLRGQARVLAECLPTTPVATQQLAKAIERCRDGENAADMLAAEARAATVYWRAWESVPMQFARVDSRALPAHWRTVGERHSALSSGPRLAVTSAQAVFNYLYSLAEFESQVALLAIGLDPGLGWFHRDASYRDSAALDLMEAIRPDVDGYVAELLAARTFARKEFRELPNGQVRVTSRLAHVLATSGLPLCEKRVASHAEEVARIVAASASSHVVVRTRLSQADRRRGRNPNARQPKAVPNACRLCGLILERPDRQYCPDCIPAMRQERSQSLSAAGSEALRQMRASPDDPAKSPEARAKKSARLKEHVAAIMAWEAEHGRVRDPARHDREVLPIVRKMSVRRLASLTGLSSHQCWRVRNGERRLHPRFWALVLNESEEAPSA